MLGVWLDGKASRDAGGLTWDAWESNFCLEA